MAGAPVGPADLANIARLPPEQRPLNAVALGRLRPLITREFRRIWCEVHTAGIKVPPTVAIEQTFLKLFGNERDDESRMTFVMFIAPIVRHLLLQRAAVSSLDTVSREALDLWRLLHKLERLAPQQAQVIDLHCFAGIDLARIATLLSIPPAKVARDVRFVKAWLAYNQSRMESNES
jgi:hypothetical protein